MFVVFCFILYEIIHSICYILHVLFKRLIDTSIHTKDFQRYLTKGLTQEVFFQAGGRPHKATQATSFMADSHMEIKFAQPSHASPII